MCDVSFGLRLQPAGTEVKEVIFIAVQSHRS